MGSAAETGRDKGGEAVESNRETVYAAFTMDCLPASGNAEVQCLDRWEDAGSRAVAFVEALVAQGLAGTFFIAPEALERMGSAVEEIRAAGCERAVLCHPQLSGHQACLGSYNFERQREIVRLARKAWEDTLSESPVTFRPGFFSANDHTFHALIMEGFQQGSCSLPGRMDNEQCCMWFGSYPFPHHADPLDRTAQGTIEFLEVPVTSNFTVARQFHCATYTPPHLRIEVQDLHSYAHGLIEMHLDRMINEAVPVKVLTFITSNLVPWGRDDDPHVERLHNLCMIVREEAERRDMAVAWKSMAALHDLWDEQCRVTRRLEAMG